jgi:hypothetical protein
VKRSPAFVVVLILTACAAHGQQSAPLAPDYLRSAPSPVPHPMLAGAYGPQPLAGDQRPNEPYPANIYLAPWSRVSVGGDISPLGIGIKGTIDVNTYMDLRCNTDFFYLNPGRFEVGGFNVYPHLNLTSVGVMLDTYPWNSVWRLSGGLMLLNHNQISGQVNIAPGTEFTLDNQSFYSAANNPAAGITPLAGTGLLGLHRDNPAFIATFGFGKFIPRSQRHWSFPAEFGVIFTGAPVINLGFNGWVCKDLALTQCSNLGNPANPITMQFNSALNSVITRWRNAANDVPVYPVFAYSVVYSFDIRH